MELGMSFVQKTANSLRKDSNQQGSYSTFTNGLATQDTENESGITSEVFKEGILDIHVHYAQQIPNICIYGKQDVFGKFFVLDMEDDAVCTKVSNNAGHNPVFDEKLRVKISQPNAVLKCEMWMASRDTSYLPDQVLGSVKIPLSEILAKQKYAEDYGLSSTELCHSPAGTVRLSFSFTESSASSDVIRVVNLDTRNESGEAFKEGILDIHVHYAEQIHNICIYGKQDVFGKFFVLEMEDDAVCTKVSNNAGQNPVFYEKLRVKISQPNAVLKCEMWMASRDKSYLPDQVLGFVEIPFSEILAKQKYAEDYGLSSTELCHSPAGTVRLSFSFTESSATSEVTRLVNLDTGNESGITSEVFKEGILDIHVQYAEQNHNIKQDVFGKFFVLEMEDDAVHTKVLNNAGQNPVFDEKLRVKISQPNAVLKCEMWMASRDKSYLPDQVLGFVEIPFSEILAKQKYAEDYGLSSTGLWHSRAGTVRLSFSFTESSATSEVTRVVNLDTGNESESGITSEVFKEGILDIHVHYAEQIHNICIYGKQDVFGKLFVLEMEKDAICTKVSNNAGQNPVFDEKLRLKIFQPNAVLKCEMWMASRDKSYLPDQMLGFVEIPLSEILAKQKHAEDYGLSSSELCHSPAGTVRLSFSFTESSESVDVTRVVDLGTNIATLSLNRC